MASGIWENEVAALTSAFNKLKIISTSIETDDPPAEVQLNKQAEEEINFRMHNTIKECAGDFEKRKTMSNLYKKYEVDMEKLFPVIDKTVIPYISKGWLKRKKGVSKVAKAKKSDNAVKLENIAKEAVEQSAAAELNQSLDEIPQAEGNNLKFSENFQICALNFIKAEILKCLRLKYELELVDNNKSSSIIDKVIDPYVKEGWLKPKSGLGAAVEMIASEEKNHRRTRDKVIAPHKNKGPQTPRKGTGGEVKANGRKHRHKRSINEN